MTPSTHPLFWRDDALPQVELRYVPDGHKVAYAAHSHREWSIGAILDGKSAFLCADRQHTVSHGDIVMMDPNIVHACNPLPNSPWAYYMMHIDVSWLAGILYESGLSPHIDFYSANMDTLKSEYFYKKFIQLAHCLMRDTCTQKNELNAQKAAMLKSYLVRLFEYLYSENQQRIGRKKPSPPATILAVAAYLDEYYLDNQSIKQLSQRFNISTSYLVRSFTKHFSMSPHAYRLNKRIQEGQIALKSGCNIVDIAQTVGFNDQAHFQRSFKQRVAATPKQYQSKK
ncbi:AraC family transcriptional regulator [Marinomonas sp. 15G1-11]|uniref:AraC family transcriptional regulator n=1 Tax=Marinomonas phaeophyticola TaxID=3004091 RepID=A0ABT4JVD5_9GAMM|nr:AraC family transcriptional regulator [Marinomonas sp. 15G1-11]MCZ2722012.1 AraC family transcriptional regulator [Marinomonas sp. 15G1-11]